MTNWNIHELILQLHDLIIDEGHINSAIGNAANRETKSQAGAPITLEIDEGRGEKRKKEERRKKEGKGR